MTLTPNAEPPTFLSVPPRQDKPRSSGVTHVLDKGLPLEQTRVVLDSVGRFVDIWKFGYGLAYIDRQLPAKLDLLATHSIRACPGGTLAEIAWLQGKWSDYLDWLERVGLGCLEVSSGATDMPVEAKRELISTAADRGFEVFAEVGSKDPGAVASAREWAAQAKADLEAGATWIVAEGRESGTVGLYNAFGEVRPDLVDALAAVDAQATIIYEAPQRDQQAWLIRHVGAQVNLGNVAVEEILSLEALRLGLRSGTTAPATDPVLR